MAESFVQFAHISTRGETPLLRALAWRCAGEPEVLSFFAGLPPEERAPHLFMTTIHYLLLKGVEHPFAAHVPSIAAAPPARGTAWRDFLDFFAAFRDDIARTLAGRSVQLNEVGRAAALRAGVLAACPPGPIALVDLGASAGLNLLLDRYGYAFDDGRSVASESPVVIPCRLTGREKVDVASPLPEVRSRVGVDCEPRSVTDDDDVTWLRAAIWPEATERAELFLRAVELARRDPPRVIAGDAVELLPDLVAEAELSGGHPCVLHSATTGWMAAADRERLYQLLRELGGERPIAWVSLEGHPSSPVADLVSEEEVAAREWPFLLGVSRLSPRGESRELLAFSGVHGRWIEWYE